MGTVLVVLQGVPQLTIGGQSTGGESEPDLEGHYGTSTADSKIKWIKCAGHHVCEPWQVFLDKNETSFVNEVEWSLNTSLRLRF